MLDYDAIWDSVDNTETVTLQTHSLNGSVSNDASVTALRRAPSRPVDGGLPAGGEVLVWNLRASTVTTAPRDGGGDKIIQADNTTWLTISSQELAHGTTYRCETRKAIGS